MQVEAVNEADEARRAKYISRIFVCLFVSRRAYMAETAMPSHPFNNKEHGHSTVRHHTIHYRLRCLRMGAQARQKSPG